MINIPMNTKPALDLSSFAGGGSGLGAPSPAPQAQPMNNMGFDNQGMGMNNMGNMGNMNSMDNMGGNFGQAPMNNYQQAPVQQPTYQQPAPAQPVYQQAPVQQPVYQQPAPAPAPVQQAAPAPVQRPAGGGVILKKGQKVDLMKSNAALTEIDVCLGWDILNQACDLDTSAFMLGANNKVIGDDWFVFYGQTASPDGSIIHHGDSRNGAGAGDDEIITVRLNQVNQQVSKITFVVTINEALENNLNFSMVANAYIRIVDKSTGKELVKFNLTDYYANVTSMVVGEVYRHNGTWKLNAVGDGVAKDLAGLCAMYGVNVAG